MRINQRLLRSSEFDELLKTATADGGLPGVVAAVTNSHEPLYLGCAGVRTTGSDRPMDTSALCHIASMTKPITAAAALLLVEEGKLSLEQPAGEIIPYFYDARVLTGFDRLGAPQTRSPVRPITLRHLLTHTAGIANETWSADTARCIEASGRPGSAERFLASLHAPLLHDPGERWWYGMGLDWAGRMIEAVSGESLGQFLSDRVLRPLGMRDTGFQLDPVRRQQLASIHTRDSDGSLKPVAATMPDVPALERGGGGLYSTAADYLAFIRLFLNNGAIGTRQLLQHDTVRLLTENQLGELRVMPLKSAQAARSNDMEILPEIDKTWSLGFMINAQQAPTGRPAGSLAWAGINNTYFWIDRNNGIGGVVLCQLQPFLDVQAQSLARAFENAVYKSLG